MLGVHGDAVVIRLATGSNVLPAAFLFFQIETGGVGEEDEGQHHAGETEPGHDVKLQRGGNVVVQDGSGQGAEFAASGGETVRGGTDGSRVDFGGHEEGDGVGAELVEKGGEEVHGLEFGDVCLGGVVLVVEARDDEEDEIHEEADHLHLFAAVELVIDEKGWWGQQRIASHDGIRELTGQVVSAKGDTDIDQIVEPSGHDGFTVVRNHGDEFGLEQLVAVEENVVAVPAASGGDEARAEVGEGELEGLGIVAGDLGLFLRGRQLLARGSHLVGTEINQPQRADGGNGKGNPVGPLYGHFRIRRVPASVVKAQKGNDEDDLVGELTPALHQEGAGDFPASVKTILLG